MHTRLLLLSCLFLLFSLTLLGQPDTSCHGCTWVHRGIVRMDSTRPVIYLVFTAHEFGDGGEAIARTLQTHKAKASFFFTGDFYRNPAFARIIRRLKQDGHYLGPHSDRHLLYVPWENRDSLLVTRDQFVTDLRGNYAAMARFGISKSDAPYFLPAFEWYNDSISTWTREEGVTLVNFTPGTYANADWTYPGLGAQYLSSDTIAARIMRYEQQHGLNGFLLLTHFGTDPRSTDKLYMRLDEIMSALERRGYDFERLKQESGPGI